MPIVTGTLLKPHGDLLQSAPIASRNHTLRPVYADSPHLLQEGLKTMRHADSHRNPSQTARRFATIRPDRVAESHPEARLCGFPPSTAGRAEDDASCR